MSVPARLWETAQLFFPLPIYSCLPGTFNFVIVGIGAGKRATVSLFTAQERHRVSQIVAGTPGKCSIFRPSSAIVFCDASKILSHCPSPSCPSPLCVPPTPRSASPLAWKRWTLSALACLFSHLQSSVWGIFFGCGPTPRRRVVIAFAAGGFE